jgi:aconitate decarboxylase
MIVGREAVTSHMTTEAQLPWSRIGVEGVTALDDAGDAVLVGWGGRATSATSAAMVNSSFVQGFRAG